MDQPIFDGIGPVGEAFCYKRTVFGFIKGNDLVCRRKIGSGDLTWKAFITGHSQPSHSQSLDSVRGDCTDIVHAALERQPTRIRPPVQTPLFRQCIKKVLGKSAAVVVSRTEK